MKLPIPLLLLGFLVSLGSFARGAGIEDAVDAASLVWSTGGDAAWFPQSSVTLDGMDAIASGAVLDSQESWVATTVTGPGRLSWHWKVSSEFGFDFLMFQLDGITQAGAISGEFDWHRRFVDISDNGTHVVRWRYAKDGLFSEGQDRGWLDQVSFVPAGASQPSFSPDPRADIFIPNSPVLTTLETNGVLYLGGDFTHLSPNQGRGSSYHLLTGTEDPLWPDFDGGFTVVVEDGEGGWFVGGKFATVDGVRRENIVHLLPDRTVDPNWVVEASGADSEVVTLALADDVLYLGGTFTTVNGEIRQRLAAVDAGTGALLTWAPVTDGFVYVVRHHRDRLYVGGVFDTVNGSQREGLAEVDLNGDVTSWNPGLALTNPAPVPPIINFFDRTNVTVFNVGFDRDTMLIAGTFDRVEGQPRSNLAAFDLQSRQVTDWRPDPDGNVFRVAIDCGEVFLSGAFTNVGGARRQYVASVELDTGRAKPWTVTVDEPVLKAKLGGDNLYLVGRFEEVNGEPRPGRAAVNRDTGVLSPWNPEGDTFGFALTISGDRVITSGIIPPGAIERSKLAAIDVNTGHPLPWAPEVEGGVLALAYANNIIYCGGIITNVNGMARNNLAAIDATTGELLAWAPAVDAPVDDLAVHGGRVYIAGSFTTVDGVSRRGLAAVDSVTGQLTNFDPISPSLLDGFFPPRVSALKLVEDALYFGGFFTSVQFQERVSAAAVDLSTGNLLPWNPALNVLSSIAAIDAQDGRVFLGGGFVSVREQPYNNLASVDPVSGQPHAWSPNPDGPVFSLAANGDEIHVGGSFRTVNGVEADGLVAVDVQTGSPTSWNPSLFINSVVLSLSRAGATLYAGGVFATINEKLQPFLAGFPLAGFPRIDSHPVSQRASLGADVALAATATTNSLGPLSFQWRHDGVPLAGATNSVLTLSNVQLADGGDYTVAVSNHLGTTISRIGRLTILQPLVIESPPNGGAFNAGVDVTLSVGVSGSPAPAYQWRRNGVNIPGAVFPTYTITNAQPKDAGSYNVVVANVVNAVQSDPVSVVIPTAGLTVADAFGDAVALPGNSGLGAAVNSSASSEVGEPLHGDKQGGKSIWVKWTAPADGIFRASSLGSDFDTLLGAYTGTAVDQLSPLAGDDDSGGFLNSEIAFNVAVGTTYHLAIDGFFGAQGRLVLSWSLETSVSELPVVLSHPLSQTVTNGADVVFTVVGADQPAFRVQWEFNCRDLLGETNQTLSLTNVQEADVGQYTARLISLADPARVTLSRPAQLEIGVDPKTRSRAKLEEAIEIARQTSGARLPAGLRPALFNPVRAGVTDTQILNNLGATTQPCEPIHAAVIAGSSIWFPVQTESAGLMEVNTIGSEIDTVLAVYVGTTIKNLQPIAADNNGAPDGIRSVVRFPVRGGQDYLIAIDGVGRAEGRIVLNRTIHLLDTVFNNHPQAHAEGVTQLLSSGNLGTPLGVSYQWRLNGQNISGANGADYTIPHFDYQTAGVYSLVFSNAAGVITNHIADLRLYMNLQLGPAAGNNGFRLQLTNRAPFILEGAEQLLNPNWIPLRTNTANASLDFTDMSAATNAARYYRIVPAP